MSLKSGLLIFIDLLQSFSFCSIFKIPLSVLFIFSGSHLFQSLFVCMFLSNSFSFFFKLIDSLNFSCFCFFIEKILRNSQLLLKPNIAIFFFLLLLNLLKFNLGKLFDSKYKVVKCLFSNALFCWNAWFDRAVKNFDIIWNFTLTEYLDLFYISISSQILSEFVFCTWRRDRVYNETRGHLCLRNDWHSRLLLPLKVNDLCSLWLRDDCHSKLFLSLKVFFKFSGICKDNNLFAILI